VESRFDRTLLAVSEKSAEQHVRRQDRGDTWPSTSGRGQKTKAAVAPKPVGSHGTAMIARFCLRVLRVCLSGKIDSAESGWGWERGAPVTK